MDIVLALLVGIAIGWFVDWYFWRRRSGPSTAETTLTRDLATARSENQSLAAQLEAALNRRPEVIVKEVPVSPARDRLQEIKGIGDVFASRLNEAGIFTFSALAATTPDQLKAIIKPASWQEFNYQDWSDAAGQLAAQRQLRA